MTEDGIPRPLLWRMAARASPPEAETQVTPTRALRIALTRAAEQAAGLTTTALGVSDDVINLAEFLARLDDTWLFLRMDGGAEPGLFAIDPGFLSAIIEMQMRGKVGTAEPDRRPLTSSDAALALPLVASFLAQLGSAATGGALADWVAGRAPGDRLGDLRAIGLVLPECDFRVVGLSAWLGAGDRQGQIMLALPEPMAADPMADQMHRLAAWSAAFQDNVLTSCTTLSAVLHRMRLPLSAVQSLQVGQKMALPGVRVSAVRIEAPDGRIVGRGRLGQAGGMRAVRIEPELLPELEKDPAALSAPAAPRE